MPPKLVWNAETDAKLFHGILAQLSDTNVKLDNEALAKHMGPEYVAIQITRRLGRIRGFAKADADESPAPSAPGTPATSSEKRKRAATPRAPRAKKPKKDQKEGNEEKPKRKGRGKKEKKEQEQEQEQDEGTDVEQPSTDLKDLADVLGECEDMEKSDDGAMDDSEEEKEAKDDIEEDA